MNRENTNSAEGKPPRVLLQYITLIHYRESVFNEIAADPRIDFTICCGKKSPYHNMRNFAPQPPLKVRWVRNFVLNITQKHFVLWQGGIFWNLIRNRPDVLVLLGADPHNVSSFPLFFLAKLLRVRICWWSHATLGEQGAFGKFMRLFFYRNADGILAYDETGRQRLIAAGIREQSTQTLWNCLNDADYRLSDPASKKGRVRDRIRLLYVGRLYYDKKMHLLIEAAQILHERGVQLDVDIVGDGPELENTKRRTDELDLNDIVHFHGARFADELKPFLDSADLGVVPSWAGLSVVQYMAAGIPVITEENRGFNHPPEVSAVIEGQTGAFYEFESTESLADTIQSLIPGIDELSVSCLRLVEERFTPQAVKNAFIEGIFKVINA